MRSEQEPRINPLHPDFKNNVEMAAGLAKGLDVSPEMVDYLAESEEKARAIKALLG